MGNHHRGLGIRKQWSRLVQLTLLLLGGVVGSDALAQPLQVVSFQPNHSGFQVQFNRPLDATTLNLYSTQNGNQGPADITVMGSATGPVVGSLLVGAAGDNIFFLKSGGPLAVDTYNVTLRSAANGFRATDGTLLDGNGDGAPGGDFTATFAVAPFAGPVVSLPDFARGPGQTVNLPASGVGIPVRLSDGAGVQSVQLLIDYNPALLRVLGLAPGAALPGNSQVAYDTPQFGTLRITISASSPLPSGPIELVRITAKVPQSASYRALHRITFAQVSLNGGAIAAFGDDALHAVAYLGDTTGNGGYSSLDGQRVLRVSAQLDSGFDAYLTLDPVIIGDVSGNGAISSLDATRVLQRVAGTERPEFAPLPTVPLADAGKTINTATGLAVTLDGSQSHDPDGDEITFRWTLAQKPAGSAASLANGLVPNPTFTADVAGDYLFDLVVDDGDSDSAPARVTLRAFTGTAPPNARAGKALNARIGSAIALDGSQSFNAPPASLSYSWFFVALPSGSGLNDNSLNARFTTTPSFTPDVAGSYVIALRAGNGALTDDDTVTVTAANPNVPPNAQAGADRQAPVGSEVDMSGQSSFDPDNGPAPLSYLWRFVTRPPQSRLTHLHIADGGTGTPMFVPDAAGSYLLQLKVSDADRSAIDNVLVTAGGANQAPLAVADSAATALNTAVTVTVLANDSDPDGDPLVVAGVTQPAQGSTSVGQNNTVTYTPNVNFTGSDTFGYSISDGRGGFASATVAVTVGASSLTIVTAALPSSVTTAFYNQILLGNGGSGLYTWSIANGTLPAGLSLSPEGVLSGTLTTPGTANFTIRLQDGAGASASRAFSIAVSPSTLAVITTAVPSGKAQENFTFALSASGGVTPYSWSIAAGVLPQGLTLAPNGVISGVPTAANAVTFFARVQDAAGARAERSFLVTIEPQGFTVVSNQLPSGTVNTQYNQALFAANGTPPYSWSLASGTLPAGLTLSANGAIGGTPTLTGSRTFSVQARDAAQTTVYRSLTLTILSSAIDGYWSFDDGLAGDNSGNGNHGALFNGPAPIPGKVGPALNFDGSSHVTVGDVLDPESGDLSALAWVKTTQAGALNMILSKRNSQVGTNAGYQLFQNSSGTLSFTFSNGLSDRVIVHSSGPRINDGQWHLVGVVFNRAGNGVLYVDGVPAAGGAASIAGHGGVVDNPLPLRFGVEEQTGNPAVYWQGAIDEVRIFRRALSAAEIAALYPLTIASTSIAAATQGVAFNYPLAGAGGALPYSWSIISGNLPPGLSFSSTGLISGNPLAPGSVTFTVQLRDSQQNTVTQSFALTVASAGVNGHWSFDDGTATDNSGNGFHGSVVANALPVAGKTGQALGFNGVGQHVNLGSVLDAGTGDLSLFAWVKATESGPFKMIISKRDSSQFNNAGYQLFQNENGTLSFTFADGNSGRVKVDSSGPRINDGNWHLVGVVFNRGGNGVLYVDGIPASDGAGDIRAHAGNVVNSLPLRFAAEESGLHWQGAIDEVRIYRRAFSPQEVADLFPLSIVSTNLPQGTNNQPYSYNLVALGGQGPYNWSVAAGSLPPGLALSASGTISGTPTTAGTSTLTLRVQDSLQGIVLQPITLTVAVFGETFNTNLSNWAVVDEGANDRPSLWEIANGVVVQRTNIWGGSGNAGDPVAPGTYIHAGNPAWRDYTFSVRLMSQDNDGIGVMFRYQDSQNYYRFSMNGDLSRRSLVKVVNGVSTLLAEDFVPYVVGRWYNLKVSVAGSRIQVSVDQSVVFDQQDGSLSQGKIALYSWANAGAFFDDVFVNDTGVFYLATNGDDSNPGTEQLPFRTLRRAILEMKGGDKLIIRGGEYRAGRELNSSGDGSIIPSGLDASRRTVFQSYPGETVVWRTYLPDNSTVDEVTLRESFKIFRQQDCINRYGGDGGWPVNCPSADDITTPYASQLGVPFLEQVMTLFPADLRYIDFDGIVFDARGISGAGVAIFAANNIRFMNGEIRNSIKSCVNTPGVTNLPPARIEFINMKIHHCGIPYDAVGRLDQKTRYWHGFYIEMGGFTFDGNEIYSNAGNGIGISGNSDIIVRNNVIHDHPIQGIFNGSNNGQLIYNNLLYNNPTGIQISGPDCNTRIYNNTLIGRQDYPFELSTGIYLQSNLCSQSIENNIIVDFNQGIVVNPHSAAPHAIANNLIYNNVIAGQGTYDISDFSNGRFTLINNRMGGNFDARFANPAARNYNLQPESAAIDGGLSNGLSTDNDGCPRPVGGGIDIGAYEHAPGCSLRN